MHSNNESDDTFVSDLINCSSILHKKHEEYVSKIFCQLLNVFDLVVFTTDFVCLNQ